MALSVALLVSAPLAHGQEADGEGGESIPIAATTINTPRKITIWAAQCRKNPKPCDGQRVHLKDAQIPDMVRFVKVVIRSDGKAVLSSDSAELLTNPYISYVESR
jgi:hypothetical protein